MAKHIPSTQEVRTLKGTVVKLEASVASLQGALHELGYCHEQTTQWITDNASGADGLISTRILFEENKVALAEAIATNKRLTDDAEFQAHRYTLQSNRLAQTARCCQELGDKLTVAYRKTDTAHKWLCASGLVLFAALIGATAHALAVVL